MNARARIHKAMEEGKTSFRWPLCESCNHGRSSHAPERGGWRCHFKGKKRNGVTA